MAKTEIQPIRTDADKVTNRANLNDEMDFFAKHTGPGATNDHAIKKAVGDELDLTSPVPELIAGSAKVGTGEVNANLKPILSILTLVTVGLGIAGFYILRKRLA